MSQMQLINSVLDWERRLEIEEEKRKNHRYEPYVNYLAAPQPCRKEHRSLLERIFGRRKERQPVYPVYPQEPCRETQPG